MKTNKIANIRTEIDRIVFILKIRKEFWFRWTKTKWLLIFIIRTINTIIITASAYLLSVTVCMYTHSTICILCANAYCVIIFWASSNRQDLFLLPQVDAVYFYFRFFFILSHPIYWNLSTHFALLNHNKMLSQWLLLPHKMLQPSSHHYILLLKFSSLGWISVRSVCVQCIRRSATEHIRLWCAIIENYCK